MDKIIDVDEFKLNCIEGICLRQTFISKNCERESKQIKCYNKYVKKLYGKFFGDTNKHQDRKEFREKILKRDLTCKVWEILDSQEKKYVMDNFYEEYILFSKQLDVCHIIPRSADLSLIFDEENVFLASRYFHSLLDKYLHPVTREKISTQKRLDWCYWAKKGEKGEH